MDDIDNLLSVLLNDSEFLKSLRPLLDNKSRSGLSGDAVRPLTGGEIGALKAQGNTCREWEALLVADEFIPGNVFGNTFIGKCVLGIFDGNQLPGRSLIPCFAEIRDSTICDSEIASGCSIRASCVSGYIIKKDSVVGNVGSLACSKNSSFGNGRPIAVSIESGGREVLSFAELTIAVAHAVATRRGDRAFLQRYADFVAAYTALCHTGRGIVERGCICVNTPSIEDAYLGPGSFVNGATLLSNCTLLGSAGQPVEISHGAIVQNSCVQWGCTVTSHAIVDNSALGEQVRVERHGKVSSSIIGPNTAIAEGEVTASIVGPFVGFHHQALLIGVLWPEGKGNVGYGANVGSNHTGKAPDQEMLCGEGMFFGLGVNIKFPANFIDAPYSIIATGVTTGPQKLEFPFSLINTPSRPFPGVSPFFNEIFPGWVLSDNIYAIKRNEIKFRKRNKARRTSFDFGAWRPEIIDMMVRARDRLARPATPKEFYGGGDIQGLGRNCMTEKSRTNGIAAYEFYIEYYCLSGLKDRLGRLIKAGETEACKTVYVAKNDGQGWERRRMLLVSEGHARRSVRENLLRLAEMERQIARTMQIAKEKDDVRGNIIIPDYGWAHTPAADDPFVKEARTIAEQVKKEIGLLIEAM